MSRCCLLALVAIGSVVAYTRASQAQSQEPRWLVVPALVAADESQPEAAINAAHALENAFENAGLLVVENPVAAERFEARHPTAIALGAEKQKTLLKALTEARRELILGRLQEADDALQSVPGVHSPELDVLRRTHAKLLAEVCVTRAYILRRDGHSTAAHEAMVRCVVTYSELKPPVQPEDRDLFSKSLASVSFSQLVVRGPSGCAVRLFGIEVGRTPLTLSRVALGRTPVQLECTEHTAGRRHMIDIEAGTNSIEIEPRFDQVVRSRGGLQILYDQSAALDAHLHADAASLGRMLNARLILIENDKATPTVYRVSAHGTEAAELGELHYDARAGVDRDDLLHIVEGLRSATRGRPTPTVARAMPTHEANDTAPSARGVTETAIRTRSALVEPVVGAAIGVLGVGGLITGWALYAERQEYRLEARPAISVDVMQGFAARGTRMLAIGGAAAAGLVAAEYLLLPNADGVPVAAWIAGAAGAATAAIGLAYTLGGDACEPMAVAGGERTSRACYARTADGMFGPMLMLSAVPLLSVPIVYMFRRWLGSAAGGVSLTPTGIAVRGKF